MVQLKKSLLLYTVCKLLVTPGQEQTTLAKLSQSTTKAKRKRFPMSEEKVAGVLLKPEADCKHIVVYKVSLILPSWIQEYEKELYCSIFTSMPSSLRSSSALRAEQFSGRKSISSSGKEPSTQEAENNQRNSTESNRSTPRSSPLSALKSVQGVTSESKKSAAERFRELRRQNGLRNRSLEDENIKNKGKSTKGNFTHNAAIKDTPSKERLKQEDNDSGFFDRHNTGEIRRNDLDSTVADVIKPKSNALKNMILTDGHSLNDNVAADLNISPGSPRKEKTSIGLRGTSRAILCATKFKRATSKDIKTPKGSPLPNKKQLEDFIGKSDVITKVASEEPQNESPCMDTIEIKRNDSDVRLSPNTQRRQFRTDRSLRRGGIHTSMLSVASNTCLTDSEMDDTVSIYSEMDSLDDERGTRGRRWDSFHSNISADSGSAHLFEFETDSLTTEYDEVFDDHESGGETLCY